MIDEIANLLKESIGKGFRYADLNGRVDGVIEEIHIENKILSINDINIDLEKYTLFKLLDKNLISFNRTSFGTALVLIK
ncbi:hypothetical protein [Clostridium sardiniense]|uniref:hypothetical protein n=1 Tax=Clostridium sardiniense TaxID=29369 RepID=UPI00195A1741|nr:hypothetical protein [Clostridium sardiniense]MBM7835723.1 hypothetical protein [Clostridium sardiniense]